MAVKHFQPGDQWADQRQRLNDIVVSTNRLDGVSATPPLTVNRSSDSLTFGIEPSAFKTPGADIPVMVALVEEPDPERFDLLVRAVEYADTPPQQDRLKWRGQPFSAYPMLDKQPSDYEDFVETEDQPSASTKLLRAHWQGEVWLVNAPSSSLPPHSGIHLVGISELEIDFMFELDPDRLSPISPRHTMLPPERAAVGIGGDTTTVWIVGVKDGAIFKLDAQTMNVLKFAPRPQHGQHRSQSIGGGKDGAWLLYHNGEFGEGLPNMRVQWVHPETLQMVSSLDFEIPWARQGSQSASNSRSGIGGVGTLDGVIWLTFVEEGGDLQMVKGIYRCHANLDTREIIREHRYDVPLGLGDPSGIGGDEKDVFICGGDVGTVTPNSMGNWWRLDPDPNRVIQNRLFVKADSHYAGVLPRDIGGGGL
jgi:hypothetical protein